MQPVLLALGFYAGKAVERLLDWTKKRLQRRALTRVDFGEVPSKRPSQETNGHHERDDLKPTDKHYAEPRMEFIAHERFSKAFPGSVGI